MHIKKINAFTLIEIIVVVMMIWILMMATTMYLWWSDEKRKTIEAQWCANAIWWEINNFLFYTLTSKHLSTEIQSPNFYIIEFTWWNNSNYCFSGYMCDKINLSYSTWDTPTNVTQYKTLTISTTCQQNNQPLKFWWDSTGTTHIIMNKWFSPRSINDKNVFYLRDSNNNTKSLLWHIVVWLCLNNDCTNPKQIWRFVADARSQTVSLANCKYYDNDNPTKCKTWEGCQIYDTSDSTICQKY